MATLYTIIAEFFSKVVTGITKDWMDKRESRIRGETEAENRAHLELAKRKGRADGILAEPIKKGKALIDSLRSRNKSD